MPVTEPIADRIARVATKVRQRGLTLGPCITQKQLLAFEKRYNITIPAEYREFLLRIGNGAPGPPDYGLI